MRRLILGLVLALTPVLSSLAFATPVMAATSDNITVTATPAFLSITVTPDTWAPNDIVGNGVTPKGTIAPDTVYYANPLGDATVPSDPVVDGECRFTITNTSSVNTTITINFPDHTGGDASTNSNLGTNDTTKFGAYSYFSGNDYSTEKVIVKAAGSDPAYVNLGATTNILLGLAYESQSNAWTSATPMVSTVNVAATYYMPP